MSRKLPLTLAFTLVVSMFVAAAPLAVTGAPSPGPDSVPPASAPLIGDPSLPGPRPVASTQLSYSSGGQVSPVDVYYPSSGPAGAVVILLPGGLPSEPAHHAGHGQHLASHGFVVGVVHDADTFSSADVAPNARRAGAALDGLRAAPELAGRLTDRAAVVGAHYNGTSALVAAASDARFRAVVGLHPSTFGPGGGGSAGVGVPYLALGGNVENGLLCPYGTTWLETFQRAASIHRSGYLFAAARPADFQDPAPSELFDFCGQPRATPFLWIKGLMTAWLAYYVHGDLTAAAWLYTAEAGPSKPADVSDSQAFNAPRRLLAVTAGEDGLNGQVSWDEPDSDATTLRDVALRRAVSEGPFVDRAVVPLGTASHGDEGLTAGTTYRYTAAFRDRGGRVFQTAAPAGLVAGAPTPTPSATPRPTQTPGPTATPTLYLSPTPSATRTATSTRTPTLTRTPTQTRTATLTRTPTITRTPSRTPSPRTTATPGPSPTGGASDTPAATATVPASATAPPEPAYRLYLPRAGRP